MKLLVISNTHKQSNLLSKTLKGHDIDVTYKSYNEIFAYHGAEDFQYTAAILIVESALEMKQFILLIHQKKIQIPKLLLWRATRNVPTSLKDSCEHHLTASDDPVSTALKIKDIIYAYTVNDLYNNQSEMLNFEGITLDRRYRRLKLGNKERKLTNKEFALLEFFMLHPQKLLCRNTILESVWDINKTFMTNTIDVHIGKLRKILGDKSDLIKTIHSVGYIFG